MYSPKIREDLVRAMYRVKQQTGITITRQANEAIEAYLARAEQSEAHESDSVSSNDRK